MTALGKTSPAEARNAGRCAEYRRKLDDHLDTLPSDAARRKLLDRLSEEWVAQFQQFQIDVTAGKPVTGTAWEYHTTMADIENRRARYGSLKAVA